MAADWNLDTEDSEDDADEQNYVDEADDSAGITPTKMAQNSLRQANEKESTGSITLVGDPRLVAGVTATLKNFGTFDDKYIILKASHHVSSSGYSVDVELRKCLNGY